MSVTRLHYFDIDYATEYGMPASVLINFFQYWIDKNKADGRHFHDGRTWTYNTTKALTKLLPYLSDNQIRGAMKKLIDAGIIIKGNFNKTGFDRTTWYAFADETAFVKITNELCSSTNGLCDNHGTIPVKNTVNEDIKNKQKDLPDSLAGSETEEEPAEKKSPTPNPSRKKTAAKIKLEAATLDDIREWAADQVKKNKSDPDTGISYEDFELIDPGSELEKCQERHAHETKQRYIGTAYNAIRNAIKWAKEREANHYRKPRNNPSTGFNSPGVDRYTV